MGLGAAATAVRAHEDAARMVSNHCGTASAVRRRLLDWAPNSWRHASGVTGGCFDMVTRQSQWREQAEQKNSSRKCLWVGGLGGFDRVLYCKFKFGVQDSETLRVATPQAPAGKGTRF